MTIILPPGVSTPKRTRLPLRARIQKEWISTLADTSVLTGSLVNILVAALNGSLLGVTVLTTTIAGVLAVVRIAR